MTAFDLALNFHGIGEPKRPLEAGEELYWITEAFFISILSAVIASGKRVLLTFDDSNLSDIEIAAPHLKARSLKAIFFVLTGRLDTPGSLTSADVIVLRDMGMDIGTHGHDQVDLTALESTKRKQQVCSSKTILEQLLGTTIEKIGIPYGNYSRSLLRDLRMFGFKEIYTSDGGPMLQNTDVLPRTSVRRNMSMADIENILRGRERKIRNIRRRLAMTRKAWL
jgi:peptidoglycan/xylan/chitin deacetylase (PgdA/CDA1 family)